MFYAAPTIMYKTVISDRAHFFTPRWEVAIDLRNENFQSDLDFRIKNLLAWLADEDGLVPDESHAVGGFDEAVDGLPLFIPNVVMESHNAVTYGRERHGSDMENELQKLIGDIRSGRIGPAISEGGSSI